MVEVAVSNAVILFVGIKRPGVTPAAIPIRFPERLTAALPVPMSGNVVEMPLPLTRAIMPVDAEPSDPIATVVSPSLKSLDETRTGEVTLGSAALSAKP